MIIAFWKPYAVLTQFSPEGDKRTLAEFGFPPDVYPVGRLDYDSEGLLILSDEAEVNAALLRPQNAHGRVYWAQVENVPDEDALVRLRRGVVVGGHKTMPADARVLQEEPHLPPRPVPIRERKNIPTAWLELVLTEGKNRQVRKMTAAVGHPTLRLLRVAIGELYLFDLELEPGEWCELTEQDVDLLFS